FAEDVGDLLDAYEKYLAVASPSTWQDKRSWIRWWKQRLGDRAAGDLRPGDVEEALLELAKARKEATVAGYLSILRAALRRAVRDGHMASDPTSRLSIFFGFPERHVTWEEEELARVRAAAPVWCSDLLEFLRATGVRVGDALTLRWDQVRDDRIRLLEGQEKTGEPLEVPLSARGHAVLERLPRSGPLLFPGQRGGPRAYNRVLRVVQAAMAAADPKVEGRTIHDLRRSWAVELLEAGVSLELIAALLGQRTTRVAGRYAKARFTALRSVLDRLEK
ncbi:MAG TPA: tyrosine-type recombinase/integrase, partial [Nannocystaceae bacterium]|nr:tyrosine-type recombinase/integrase [Nannocystaceae bacterium]